MGYVFFKFWVCSLAFCLLFSSSLIAEESCSVKWESLLQKYFSNAPLGSFNNNSFWKIEKQSFNDVSKGSKKITLPETMRWKDSRELDLSQTSVYEYFEDQEKRFREDSSALGVESEGRDEAITDLLNFVSSVLFKKTLVIVSAGVGHSIDTFAKIKQPWLYASPVFSEKPEVYSKSYRDFLALYDAKAGNKENWEKFTQQVYPSLVIVNLWMMIAKTLKTLDPDQVDVQAWFESSIKKRSFLFLGDIHALNSPGLIEGLPSAQCLRELGYDRVILFQESLPLEKGPYSLKEFEERLDFSKSTQKYLPKRYEELKLEHPKAAEYLRNNRVVKFPNLMKMVEKVKGWKAEGMQVHLQGIETSKPMRNTIKLWKKQIPGWAYLYNPLQWEPTWRWYTLSERLYQQIFSF